MISLIIPTYNCIEFMDETIGSVLSQLPEEDELIIVDDGSTDGTAEKLAEYRDRRAVGDNQTSGNRRAAGDLRDVGDRWPAGGGKVKILLAEHRGVSAARNAGIEAASGEWIAFMDCDDCLAEGFLEKSRTMLADGADRATVDGSRTDRSAADRSTADGPDMYIFSFERVELALDGSVREVTPMRVEDRIYETASEFADHYIRSRHLLIYSACNKFYRRSLIMENGMRFREGMEFGEDRMFNYDYLGSCGGIVTSSRVMFQYMQRSAESASKKIFPNHHETVMGLHDAKVECFTRLSTGTTEEEKADFIAYDFATEIERMQEKAKAQYRDHEGAVDYRDYLGKKIHMIGIGGASMSGLAVILQNKGCTVSGSDMIEGEILKVLKERGITINIGHDGKNLDGADLAVYSMAIAEDNPELEYCRAKGIPTIERSVLLGQMSSEYGRSIAVCGTHGKTTTTSILAQILLESKVDPTVHIGGVLNSMGGGVWMGNSDIFLTEACEYRRNFMNLHPTHVLLLNIEADHLDYYRDVSEIEESFREFLGKLPEDGWALVNGDDDRALTQSAGLSCEAATFGTSEGCTYRMSDIREDENGRFSFDISYKGNEAGHVDMSIPGDFNAMNAIAAIAMAHHLGIDIQLACSIAGRFTGTHRRFEMTGTLNGAEVFHDYGHNPTEMHNAISIARKRCRRGRLWAVMQPHTYSRVKTMFEDYLSCTEEADVTLITNIFAAREKDPGDINSGMLVEAMKKKGVDARLTPEFDDAIKVLRSEVRAGDVVITMGCGDIYKLNDKLNE